MVLEVITKRWSPVSFSSRPLPDVLLREILEAARYAPSSMNEQPWLFVLVTRENSDAFRNVADILIEANRVWAVNAWAFLISLARTKFNYRDRPNRYAIYDTGMAVSNILAQAESLGISIHQMGGYDSDRLKSYLRLPDNIEPLTIMAVGYAGDGSELNDDLKLRNSTRKPRKNLREYAFRNSLSEPLE